MLRLHASPFEFPTLLLVAVIGPAVEQLAKINKRDNRIIVFFIIPFMNKLGIDHNFKRYKIFEFKKN